MRRHVVSMSMLIVAFFSGNAAKAVTLSPGASASVSGISSGDALTVIAESETTVPAFSPANSTRPLFLTVLQSQVVREAGGTLDFYYQIFNSIQGVAVDPVKTVGVIGFSGVTTDADFRTDMGGFYAPSTVSRSADGSGVTFSGYPFGVDFVFTPGVGTNALVIKTNATAFIDTGTMNIDFAGIQTTSEFPVVPASATVSTFVPLAGAGAGVPEPASLLLTAIGVLALIGRSGSRRLRI